ncbi:MAG TPA: hypothetical protein ENI33_08215 [Thermoplasmatales archaeon]|nr:hypothetical protein [Thermoplasmatales archaeon]
MAASGKNHRSDVFDVECFTPPMNMTGESKITIHVFSNFMGFVGMATMCTYSGGIGAGYKEETLYLWLPDIPNPNHI